MCYIDFNKKDCLALFLFLFGIIYPSVTFSYSSSDLSQIMSLKNDSIYSVVGEGYAFMPSNLSCAGFINPASLAWTSSLFLDTNFYFLENSNRGLFVGASLPNTKGNFNWALSFKEGSSSDSEVLRLPNFRQVIFVFGYSNLICRFLPQYTQYGAIGINLKYIQEDIDTQNNQYLTVDLGGIYNPKFLKNSYLGITFNNIGVKKEYQEDIDSFPTAISVGIGYRTCFVPDTNIYFAYTYQNKEIDSNFWNTGVEVTLFRDLVKLRLGWREEKDSLFKPLRAGLGLKIGETLFNYAFIPSDDINNIHNFSLNIGIGNILNKQERYGYFDYKRYNFALSCFYRKDYESAKKEFEALTIFYPDYRPSQKYLLRCKEMLTQIEQKKRLNIEKWLIKAEKKYQKKRYDAARDLYNNVLICDRNNESAIKGLEKVDNAISEIKREKMISENQKKIQKLLEEHIRLYVNQSLISIKQEEIARLNKIRIKQDYKDGVKFYRKGDYVSARQRFGNILLLNPDHKKAKRYLDDIDNKLRNLTSTQAQQLFMKATELFIQGKYEECIRNVEASLVISPQMQEAKELIIACREKIKEEEERKKQIEHEKRQENLKMQLDSIMSSANQLYEQGDYIGAFKVLQTSDEIISLLDDKQYVEKIKDMLLKIKKTIAQKYYDSGVAEFKKEQYEKAVLLYRRALEYDSENPLINQELKRTNNIIAQQYFEKGMSAFSSDDFKKAKEYFEKSLEYEPDKEESLRALQRLKKME